jgi:pentatricopeptide repeat protein
MKGLLDSGNPSAALTLFETACSDQRSVALTENVYLYTTAVTAAAALGDHERALELLSRMNRGGIQPNLKTMTALVGACLSAGKPDLAVDVYHRIPEPDGYAMTQGIRALGESGRVEEALSVVSSLDNHSSSLTGKQLMLSYNSLIKSSLRAGDYELARSVLAKLMSRGHIPSKATFQTLFDSMKLFPSGQLTFRQIATADEEAVEKFKFLLFVLDSVSRRNLPCEGPLYAAILSYGLRLGGLPKKIASLLVSVKTAVDDSGAEATCLVSTWEELFQRYDEVKSHVSSPADLPCLAVRVNSRDVPNVLRAEKSLLYAQKSKARR